MARRIGVASVLAVTGLGLAAPTGAFAATTIGSNLAASPTTGLSCTPMSSCTVAQSVLPAASRAPGGVLAPQDGVVVRWRIKMGTETSAVSLRITRPGNSDTRTGAGTGPTVTPPINATTPYDVQLPIQAGDALGLDCCTGPASGPFAANPAAVTLLWDPSLQDGAAPRMGTEFPSDSELLINADIEADADCDGLGDETQDSQITACPVILPGSTPQATSQATGQRAAALKKCKKKFPKGSKKRKRCIKKAKRLPV
jgi:hypothetical protein